MIDYVKEATKIPGWMTEVELKWLYEKAKEMRSILEIGAWMGRSTYVLSAGCSGTVFTVDHFNGSPEHEVEIKRGANPYAEFMANMGEFQNLVALKASSQIASQILCLPKQFEMIFVDGAHEYEDALLDFQLWGERATKLFCGHDSNYPSIQQAFYAAFPDKVMVVEPGTVIWRMK